MDFFNSFFQNVKDKLSSPFFGTLGFILVFHHWEFWYTLFNFDKECSRTEKLAILRLMASEEFSARHLAKDLVLTVIFVLVGYLIVFGMRAISLTFDHKMMTWLTGKVVSKNVVLLDTHKAVVEERDKYAEQYEEQRQRVRNFSANVDQQTKQIQEKDLLILSEGEKVNSLNNQNTAIQASLANANRDIERLKSENTDKDEQIGRTEEENNRYTKYIGELELEKFQFRNMFLSEENKDDFNSEGKFPRIILEKVSSLKKSNDFEKFIGFYQMMKHGGTLDTQPLDLFEQLELIKFVGQDLRLTIFGEIIGFHSSILRQRDQLGMSLN